jgi:hypothetical protein
MAPRIPDTPFARYYRRLHHKERVKGGPGTLELRLKEAERALRNPNRLASDFRDSVHLAERFFDAQSDLTDAKFFPQRRTRKTKPGLNTTPAVAALLAATRGRRQRVLGDSALDFFYVEREVVVTRAPGLQLESGKSTRAGLRLDLLLANGNDATPIVAEVKIGRDKDPFFALVQALANAAYLLPRPQMARIRHHADGVAINEKARRLDIYLVFANEPDWSRFWFELRDRTERLSERLLPEISRHIRRIAAVELQLPGDDKRLRITKRFSRDAA